MLVDFEYLPLLLFIDNKLVDIQVNGISRNSEFGAWFEWTVARLPQDSMSFLIRKDPEDKQSRVKKWSTPNCTWTLELSGNSGTANYGILFPSHYLTLSDGMVVRYSSSGETDSDIPHPY
ncbi:hypothetical protein KKC97_06345, partial [bacterium]|nr:hypothetical protein [bacterium]